MSEEHKQKIRESNSGEKCYNFGKKLSLESRRKMSEYCLKNNVKPPVMRGPNNPSWRGGLTPLKQKIRNSLQYRQWRSDVFTRDKFTCQECGDDQGGNLQADHIKSFSYIINFYEITNFETALNCEELWNINNGRTLCIPCHEKTPNFGWRSGINQKGRV